ncbi:hypothetical protein B7P43_G13346 [Cryptotermes secundus]|uniref:Uncharacterized protein n=1 Tax=Cryptotermes secundus TaxID=105785 RepID=A0A2J7R731_9NEOP|nr:hypothetical protein B7P43_G13346 [Cryptotermes secundus]
MIMEQYQCDHQTISHISLSRMSEHVCLSSQTDCGKLCNDRNVQDMTVLLPDEEGIK